MTPLNVWFGNAVVLVGIVLLFALRVPFAGRAEKEKVATSRRGALEVALLILVALGYIVLPVVSIFTPLLAFADYPLSPLALGAGVLCEMLGLWLFVRSHVDLGTNWSVSLEIKESHALVTAGVYRRIRHPMYTALLLTALAQALCLPNFIAGPSYFVAFLILFALRVGPEERMMRERFGAEYDDYARRTTRLVPGLF